MAMKIGSGEFKQRVDHGIKDSFMRGAVSGAKMGWA
jgi:L-lactate dehydrogenase complex protein LldF